MARAAGLLLVSVLVLGALNREACARSSTLSDGPSVVTARLLTASVPGAAAQPILIPISSGDAQPSPKVRAMPRRRIGTPNGPPRQLFHTPRRAQVDYYGNSISWWLTQRCGAAGCGQLRRCRARARARACVCGAA